MRIKRWLATSVATVAVLTGSLGLAQQPAAADQQLCSGEYQTLNARWSYHACVERIGSTMYHTFVVTNNLDSPYSNEYISSRARVNGTNYNCFTGWASFAAYQTKSFSCSRPVWSASQYSTFGHTENQQNTYSPSIFT
jgi:hypothetical protein